MPTCLSRSKKESRSKLEKKKKKNRRKSGNTGREQARCEKGWRGGKERHAESVCAPRPAAGQVLIVPTAPVENERNGEIGRPRSWRVAWFAETFIAPGEKRRYYSTLHPSAVSHSLTLSFSLFIDYRTEKRRKPGRTGWKKKARERVDRFTPPSFVTCFYIHATKHPYPRG